MSTQGVVLDGTPANVHGRAIFPVKISLPIASKRTAHADALGMVYDEQRSFQAFIDLEADDVPNLATLTRLIAIDGSAGGVSAYFDARRNGDDLLVYVDRVLAPPSKRW